MHRNLKRSEVVIFSFHGIGPIERNIDRAEYNCWMDAERFESVLDMIAGCDHVQLTFDDGNISDYEIALPALMKRRLKATFFVCSGRLGRPAFLGRSHVRELIAQGMHIGSHGIDHVSWRHISAVRLFQELEGSREALESICSISVDVAACPFGAYDRTVLSSLLRTGYRHAYTSDGGYARENKWLQPRNTITRSLSIADIESMIHGGVGLWRQSRIYLSGIAKGLR